MVTIKPITTTDSKGTVIWSPHFVAATVDWPPDPPATDETVMTGVYQVHEPGTPAFAGRLCTEGVFKW
jgi:hypothetical protein